jgi:hypothetical protein
MDIEDSYIDSDGYVCFPERACYPTDEDLSAALAESDKLDAIYRSIAKDTEAKAASWVARWPNHCAACDGWGQVGEGFPCEAIDATACHRCGEHGMEGSGEADDACRHCGWAYDDGCPF